MTSDEEPKPRPFSILRGDPKLKTRVTLPESAYGYHGEVTGRWSSRDVKFSNTPKVERDPVAEANRQMLPDNERYPQEDEDADTQGS